MFRSYRIKWTGGRKGRTDLSSANTTAFVIISDFSAQREFKRSEISAGLYRRANLSLWKGSCIKNGLFQTPFRSKGKVSLIELIAIWVTSKISFIRSESHATTTAIKETLIAKIKEKTCAQSTWDWIQSRLPWNAWLTTACKFPILRFVTKTLEERKSSKSAKVQENVNRIGPYFPGPHLFGKRGWKIEIGISFTKRFHLSRSL